MLFDAERRDLRVRDGLDAIDDRGSGGPPQFSICAARAGLIFTASCDRNSAMTSTCRGSPTSTIGVPRSDHRFALCGRRSTRPALGLVTFTTPLSIRDGSVNALRARADLSLRRIAGCTRGVPSGFALIRRGLGNQVRRDQLRIAAMLALCQREIGLGRPQLRLAPPNRRLACKSLRVSRKPAAARDMRATIGPPQPHRPAPLQHAARAQ